MIVIVSGVLIVGPANVKVQVPDPAVNVPHDAISRWLVIPAPFRVSPAIGVMVAPVHVRVVVAIVPEHVPSVAH